MEEIAGSNKSSHGDGNAATRVFLTTWSGRLTAAESLLGSAHPEIAQCWCRNVTIDPFPSDPQATGGDIADPTATAIQYGIAKLTAEYATDFTSAGQWPSDIPQPSLCEGTTLQISVRSAGEFMKFPARQARWDSNLSGQPTGKVPDSESGAGRMLVRKGEIVLTWNYVDDPPVAMFDRYIGAVNDDTPFLGKTEETLLFTGYELSEATRSSVASPACWTMRLTFEYREIRVGSESFGWNHEYDGMDGWEKVKVYNGSYWELRYTPTDFSALFTCPEES